MSAITTDTRAAWLEARRSSIGASEAAAALGLSPWKSPIDLWQEKTGRAKPTETNWRMRAGLLLEPAILDEYERSTGNTLFQRQFFAHHPDVPYLTATLDGLTTNQRAVEAKTAGNADGWGEEGTDEVPDHYQIQVQAQMACTGLEVADLPVLINLNQFRVYTVQRSTATIEAMLGILARFWWHVEHNTPPDWGKLDARALAILHPNCEGEAEYRAGKGF